mgnify:CR=1 FL=1
MAKNGAKERGLMLLAGIGACAMAIGLLATEPTAAFEQMDATSSAHWKGALTGGSFCFGSGSGCPGDFTCPATGVSDCPKANCPNPANVTCNSGGSVVLCTSTTSEACDSVRAGRCALGVCTGFVAEGWNCGLKLNCQ